MSNFSSGMNARSLKQGKWIPMMKNNDPHRISPSARTHDQLNLLSRFPCFLSQPIYRTNFITSGNTAEPALAWRNLPNWMMCWFNLEIMLDSRLASIDLTTSVELTTWSEVTETTEANSEAEKWGLMFFCWARLVRTLLANGISIGNTFARTL